MKIEELQECNLKLRPPLCDDNGDNNDIKMPGCRTNSTKEKKEAI
jgi:hypothetical protein